MQDWLSVTVMKMGMNVRIIITFPCPGCKSSIPVQWTGSPKEIHPEFPGSGRCLKCQEDRIIEVPRKSIVRWWYLAKMELQQIIKDNEKRHSASNRSSRSKRGWKRKIKKEEIDAIKQQKYSFILRDRTA